MSLRIGANLHSESKECLEHYREMTASLVAKAVNDLESDISGSSFDHEQVRIRMRKVIAVMVSSRFRSLLDVC